MKKIFYFIAIMLLGAAVFTSCKGNKKDADDEDSTKITIIPMDSISAPQLTDLVYTIGDGTTMNVLELVGEKNDTIQIECSDDAVTGGVNIGDKVAVTYISSKMDTKILTCINLTALEHVWTQKASDGHKQSLEIDELGVATTYGMSIDYDHWSISGGKLLLFSPKQVASEVPAACDTLDIMQLDDDKLVLMHGDLATEFYREN